MAWAGWNTKTKLIHNSKSSRKGSARKNMQSNENRNEACESFVESIKRAKDATVSESLI